jgi:hypothetical protein
MGIGAVAGQFRDIAHRRRAELTRNNKELTQQLERVKRSLQTLKLSHAQLEERLAATRWSLASSLETAKQRMQTLTKPQELGELVLELLSSHAMVQAASLYLGNGSNIVPEPIAIFGKGSEDAHRHALVERALRTRCLVAISDPENPSRNDPSVLAAVPLLTSEGNLVGVVAIHQLPFMAFHSDHLRKLLLIAAQLTDLMHDRMDALQTEASAPAADTDCAAPSPSARHSHGVRKVRSCGAQRLSTSASAAFERHPNAPVNSVHADATR